MFFRIGLCYSSFIWIFLKGDHIKFTKIFGYFCLCVTVYKLTIGGCYNKFMVIGDSYITTNVMRCAIWYHLHNSKNVKNTHGGVLILVKLQAKACNFTKINTPSWVFSTFLKFSKRYPIAQRISNV